MIERIRNEILGDVRGKANSIRNRNDSFRSKSGSYRYDTIETQCQLKQAAKAKLTQQIKSFDNRWAYLIGYPEYYYKDTYEVYQFLHEVGYFESRWMNIGNPLKEYENKCAKYSFPNSIQLEKEIIYYFGKLFNIKQEDLQGFITFSGTDGNLHGLYYGKKYIVNKTKQKPVLYFSEDTHTSIQRIQDVLDLDAVQIKSQVNGEIDYEEFENKLIKDRPALINANIGTTFKGAMDDVQKIKEILKRHNVSHYVHCDGALFGGYLGFLVSQEANNIVNQQVAGYNSISFSGHKFFATGEPCGVFLTTNEVMDQVDVIDVKYCSEKSQLISCNKSSMSSILLWWRINTKTFNEFRTISQNTVENAKYIQHKLSLIGVKSYVNRFSNTIYFAKPSEEIVVKYTLATVKDEELGELAHIVCLGHTQKNVFDEFIKDFAASLRASTE